MRSKTPSPSLAYVPPDATYGELVRAVGFCKACPLYERATQALLGRSFRITKGRGQPLSGRAFDWNAEHIIATYHPSALLRMMDDHEAYLEAKSELAHDLVVARSLVTFRRTRGRVPLFRERRPSRSF